MTITTARRIQESPLVIGKNEVIPYTLTFSGFVPAVCRAEILPEYKSEAGPRNIAKLVAEGKALQILQQAAFSVQPIGKPGDYWLGGRSDEKITIPESIDSKIILRDEEGNKLFDLRRLGPRLIEIVPKQKGEKGELRINAVCKGKPVIVAIPYKFS